MGKLSLILLAAVGFTAVYAATQALADDRRSDSVMLRQRALETEARQAALSGYAEAAERLGSDPTLVGKTAISPLHGEHGGGEYTVRFEIVSASPYVVRARSVGVAEGAGGASEEHVVEGRFETRPVVGPVATGDPVQALGNVPPYMRYAIFTNRSLSLAAIPTVRSNGGNYNADVHTNRQILNLSTSLVGLNPVRGFGTYSESGLFGILNFGQAFKPPVNPTGLATSRKVAPVTLPLFTSDGLIRNLLGTNSTVGQSLPAVLERVQDATEFVTDFRPARTELFGTMQLGTRENPALIYVDGDLVLFNVTLRGYGIFVVRGDVIFENTLTGLGSLLFGQPESHVAYYTQKNVIFNGLGDVHGQIVAGGNVSFFLAPRFYGSIAALGSVDLVGLPSIFFTPPSPALTTILPGNPTQKILKETSVREWETVRSTV